MPAIVVSVSFFSSFSSSFFLRATSRPRNSRRANAERARPSAVRSMRAASLSTELTKFAAECVVCRAPRAAATAVRRAAEAAEAVTAIAVPFGAISVEARPAGGNAHLAAKMAARL